MYLFHSSDDIKRKKFNSSIRSSFFFSIKIFLFSYKSKIDHCTVETEHRIQYVCKCLEWFDFDDARTFRDVIYAAQKKDPSGERNILKDWRLYDSFQISAILVDRGRTTIHDHNERLRQCCANKIDNTSNPLVNTTLNKNDIDSVLYAFVVYHWPFDLYANLPNSNKMFNRTPQRRHQTFFVWGRQRA